MNNLLASNSVDVGLLQGLGRLGLETASEGIVIGLFSQLISTAIGIMTVVAGVWFIFIFITGAYGIMSSGGEKGAYEAARKKMMTGVIGLALVVTAVLLVDFVGWIFGLDILNIGDLVNDISI